MSYLATILIIGALIFFHELGHLLAAWSVGMPVERFSIGFGPVLWKWRRGGVEYCVSAIPLGGYVLPKFESEAEFFAVPAWKRIVMWIGGPLANFVFAGVLLAGANYLTDGFSVYALLMKPWVQVVNQTVAFVAALPSVFLHPSHLSGIIGIVGVGGSVVEGGLLSTLRFAVLLNLNLAIFNLLPISPLDGGKIVCCLLEKISPRVVRLQAGLTVAGLALLLILLVYTTISDVVRQFA